MNPVPLHRLPDLQPLMVHLLPEVLLAASIVVLLLLEVSLGRKFPRLIYYGYGGILGINCLMLFFRLEVTPDRLLLGGLLRVHGAAVYLRLVIAIAAALSALWLGSVLPFRARSHPRGEFYLLGLGLVLGAQLLVMAHHFAVLYVSIELISICSYVLVAYTRNTPLAAEAGVKYVIYGGVASGAMLFGISLVLQLTGTMDFASPRLISGLQEASLPQQTVALGLIGVGILFKLAAVPMHFWAPDVYSAAPAPSLALISTAPKIGAMGAFLHLSGAVAGVPTPVWIGLLTLSLLLSLVLGNLLALRQSNGFRLLAYSSIAQAGFLLIGPVVGTGQGWAAGLYYTGVYALLNLGFVSSVAAIEVVSGSREMQSWSGLGRQYPALLVAFGVCLVGLVGLPPTAGFTGKLTLFLALWAKTVSSFGSLYLGILIAAIAFTVLSLAYYLRPLMELLRTETPPKSPDARQSASLTPVLLTVWAIGLAVLFLGVVGFDRLVGWLAAHLPGVLI